MDFKFSKHALKQMKVRSISQEIAESVLRNPDQIIDQEGNKVYQSLIENGRALVRIFVNSNVKPHTIITVYITSKIKKYYES